MKSLLGLLAITACTVAAPIETLNTFRLKSRVLSPPNPSFDGLYLEPYHIFPGSNYAVLSPQTATETGIIGYLNGTAADFANENTDLLFDTSPPPYGFIIDSVNATYNPILIDVGNGTRGIFIDQGIIKYHDPISGGFYACNNTLEYGPAVQLFYKPKVINTPTGCSDVELVVESAA